MSGAIKINFTAFVHMGLMQNNGLTELSACVKEGIYITA